MKSITKEDRTILSDPYKRRSWITYQLSLKGLRLADVARDQGVKPQTFYQVFMRPYPKMEKVISKALDIPVTDLFPERYNENGLHRSAGRAS